MKIGCCWLNPSYPLDLLFYRRAVLIFQHDSRGRERDLHSASPVKHPTNTHCDGITRTPGGLSVLGTRGWRYWPERAGGHLQHGSGQTCIRRAGPRWCRWWPDGRASPPFCHCRVWERVRWASRKNRRRSPNQRKTKEGLLAAKICSRQSGSWLHRRTDRQTDRGRERERGRDPSQQLQDRVRSKWSLFSCVDSQSSQWLLESKQMVKWCRGQSLLCAPQSLNLWMNGSDGRRALAMLEFILFVKCFFILCGRVISLRTLLNLKQWHNELEFIR